MAKIQIPIPPLHVQKEIVRILDTFTELTNRKKQYNHYRDQLLSFEEGDVEWKTLGELDVAVIGQEGAVAAREFYSARLGSLSVCAALADFDELATRQKIALKELKGRSFIGIDEQQMPGRNQWMSALCKTAGFKPRFSTVVDGITNVLSLVASENAVTLLPAYFQEFKHPGVMFVPMQDPRAKWDFIVLWQRGKVPASTRALVHELKESAARFA